jgi:hypothetical protein
MDGEERGLTWLSPRTTMLFGVLQGNWRNKDGGQRRIKRYITLYKGRRGEL